MSIFFDSPGTQSLPIKIRNHIVNATSPLLASIFTLSIVLTLVLMIGLDSVYGLDRVMAGKS